MRLLAIFALCVTAGCSMWPLATSSDEVPADAVRSYAKSHGLSHEEARRELTLFRNAGHLKELRQSEGKKMTNDQVPMTSQ